MKDALYWHTHLHTRAVLNSGFFSESDFPRSEERFRCPGDRDWTSRRLISKKSQLFCRDISKRSLPPRRFHQLNLSHRMSNWDYWRLKNPQGLSIRLKLSTNLLLKRVILLTESYSKFQTKCYMQVFMVPTFHRKKHNMQRITLFSVCLSWLLCLYQDRLKFPSWNYRPIVL